MVRLTGGIFRGRGIETPPHDRTRPTQAKLRQALYNSIQSRIPDARVLDLFAGSGALGFEALSRGAQQVVFVESARSVIKVIHKNIETLGVRNQTIVVGESIEDALPRLKNLGPFDIVMADPPYGKSYETHLLTQWPWDQILSSDGCICLEWGLQSSGKDSEFLGLPDPVEVHGHGLLVKSREKKYGDTVLTTYKRSETHSS